MGLLEKAIQRGALRFFKRCSIVNDVFNYLLHLGDMIDMRREVPSKLNPHKRGRGKIAFI